ncbi:MAG: hypothetical protein GWN00_36875, partial [Aliifodinibius sp.]|nr:hypothetical protein [Candidatus Saccharibacteria bacterium]NIT61580.1 hypothetical protein [Fodinibius sp.]NIV16182.1 hypothetical protein [Fodinibius sp.]NIY30160.1 hypothetical protein [Fodinibius sp.]
ERLIGTLQTEDKSFSGLIIVIRDVTDEVELDQARELITTTLVHDLRSPMSTVIGSLDMISELIHNDMDDQELLEQSIHVAKRSTKRVINLVED